MSETPTNETNLADIKSKKKIRFSTSTKVSCVRTLPRLIEKNGACNIESRTIRGKNREFIRDIFTTLLDTQWRLILPMFGLSVVISWLIFAGIHFAVAYAHGDFDDVDIDSEEHEMCVENSPDFISMTLFSMETQTTIGYGYRYVNSECSTSVFMVMVQSIWGALLQALLTGLVIAKAQKPKKRSNTILFSKNVCLCQQESGNYLFIRVGDLQRSDMIDMEARAVCVKDAVTCDGEYISHFRHDLELCADENNKRISLRFPVVLYHKITQDSPFWDMNEDEMRLSDFELLVFMEGLIESTGMTVQARTSYLSHEFLWQHRFKPMSVVFSESGHYEYDYKQFNETYQVPAKIENSPPKTHKQIKCTRSSSPGEESGICDVYDDDDSATSDNEAPVESKPRVRKLTYYPYPHEEEPAPE